MVRELRSHVPSNVAPRNKEGKQIGFGKGAAAAAAEAEAPIIWPPDVKSRLIRKDPDAERD